nr:GNAT family N-acetyltransferase [Clostridiales bacterium]
MNILIRNASPDDAEQLLAVYRPYVTDTAVTFEYDVPDTEAFRDRIRKILDRGYPYFVLEQNGIILGYAYASRFRERKAYDYC